MLGDKKVSFYYLVSLIGCSQTSKLLLQEMIRKPSAGSNHAREGCKYVVHGREKRSHTEVGCHLITHGECMF